MPQAASGAAPIAAATASAQAARYGERVKSRNIGQES
jgi:hypothetical protein